MAGSVFMNQPWGADGYSPLDLTVIDQHFGTIDIWRAAIDEIHRRGMYILMDNTMATWVLSLLQILFVSVIANSILALVISLASKAS